MSPQAQQAATQSIELGNATNWRTVLGSSIVLTLTLGGLIFMVANQPPPEKSPTDSNQSIAPVNAQSTPRLATADKIWGPPPPTVIQKRSEEPPAKAKLRESLVIRQPARFSPPAAVPRSSASAISDIESADPAVSRPSPSGIKTIWLSVAATPIRNRLDRVPEKDHLESLRKSVPEIDLTEKGTVAKLLEQMRKSPRSMNRTGQKDAPAAGLPNSLRVVLEKRKDLKGLPLLLGEACRIPAKEAALIRPLARDLGAMVESSELTSEFVEKIREARATIPQNTSSSVTSYRSYSTEQRLRNRISENFRAATLVQMLQAESEPARELLIELLQSAVDQQSTRGLAARALYDLAPAVREKAVFALANRSRAESRDLLLEGFRHPWVPAAEHAAEALVAMKDKRAVPKLVDLLDQPDPSAPVRLASGKWVKRELVRVNHHRNCLLCHAPSLDRDDVIRGQIPSPSEPLPRRPYYGGSIGDFVRADLVYLRQDFSVRQPVKDPGKWPELQRFDYLVRERELTTEEPKPRTSEILSPNQANPRREAVRFALRGLTGLNAEASSSAWRKALREGKDNEPEDRTAKNEPTGTPVKSP